jgi:hypothetical protein
MQMLNFLPTAGRIRFGLMAVIDCRNCGRNALGTSLRFLAEKQLSTHAFMNPIWLLSLRILDFMIQYQALRGLSTPLAATVVGCMLFVDINPSAVPDCHRAIPISIRRNFTVDRPIYMRGNILSQSTKPSCWDFPRKPNSWSANAQLFLPRSSTFATAQWIKVLGDV